jgi:tripartite-type tricarboxylate transporter receptor subunit TctC
VGSITYTFALYLNSVLGVKPTMVPFNGAAPAANALIAGHVDYMCNLIAEIGQQVQAGTVKAYGARGVTRCCRKC